MAESGNELPITRDIGRPSRAGDVGARPQTDRAVRPVITFVVCALGLSWLAFLPLILGAFTRNQQPGASFSLWSGSALQPSPRSSCRASVPEGMKPGGCGARGCAGELARAGTRSC